MHSKNIHYAGTPLEAAEKVLIMVHGRGASAGDILGLASHLNVKDFALLAPQASNHTWYPYSFMAKPEQNEPWLSSALALLQEVVSDVISQVTPSENIYFAGFSQGACLTLEFVARNARRYGGVVAFTGGLIGDKITPENYAGDFKATPVFIASGNPDPHVPLERVIESADVLKKMNAAVSLQVYDGRPHSISQDEIEKANLLVFK